MRVLVDYQIFLSQKYGGISNYHSIIHRTINGMQSESVSTILALGSDNKYIKAQGGILKPLNIRGKGKRILQSINQYALERSLPGYDVFHPTYYDNYFLDVEKMPPFVITVHDVIPERFFSDERSRLEIANKKNLINKATGIIAISETTKRQLMHFYDVAPESITVIPHGSPEDFIQLAHTPYVKPDQPPYILYVGLRWAYKNFMFFLEGIADFLRKHDIQLWIAGPAATAEEIKEIARLKITGHVVFKVRPSQAELYRLYNQAFSFAFPSLDEGFGLPLLEAAAASCPVVCSDIDIFHEIAGDSALYFDTSSRDSITEQFELLLTDSTLRQTLVQKAGDNLNRFSWKEAAQKTLEVYHKAAKTAKSSKTEKTTRTAQTA